MTSGLRMHDRLGRVRAWLTRRRCHVIALVVVSFAMRAILILQWPVVFGGDTVLRLANREHVFLSYNLPALQALLHYLALISPSIALVRCVMALIGTIAVVGFYLLACHLLDENTAFLTALLFSSNPFLLALSTVPYQETLMMAGIFFSLHFFFSGRILASGFALGVACLTRYEAWAACPILWFAYLLNRRCRLSTVAQASLVFGWAPLIWILWRRGLSPGGTYVLDPQLSLWRLMRYVHLTWAVVKFTPVAVLILAVFGLIAAYQSKAWKGRSETLPLIGFLGLFLISILGSAHGVSPDPQRYVTDREAHLLIATAVLVAGYGASRLPRVGTVAATIGIAVGVYGAMLFVERASNEPKVQLSYLLAKVLDDTVRPNERVIVLTQPIPQALLDSYLQEVFRREGTAGLEKARAVMRAIDTSPPDYQRTLIHSRFDKQHLLSFASQAACELKREQWPDTHADWVAVWSDFSPANDLERYVYMQEVQSRSPAQVIRAGGLYVSLYHTGLSAAESVAHHK